MPECPFSRVFNGFSLEVGAPHNRFATRLPVVERKLFDVKKSGFSGVFAAAFRRILQVQAVP
jgi:hypothetical protein